MAKDFIQVRVGGVAGVRTRIKKFARTSEELITVAIERSLLNIEADAKKIAPFLTGRTARSITHKIFPRMANQIRGVVGANTVYAAPLELKEGLKHRSKAGFIGKDTPFLFPAASMNFKRIVRRVRAAVRGAMRAAARGAA